MGIPGGREYAKVMTSLTIRIEVGSVIPCINASAWERGTFWVRASKVGVEASAAAVQYDTRSLKVLCPKAGAATIDSNKPKAVVIFKGNPPFSAMYFSLSKSNTAEVTGAPKYSASDLARPFNRSELQSSPVHFLAKSLGTAPYCVGVPVHDEAGTVARLFFERQ